MAGSATIVPLVNVFQTYHALKTIKKSATGPENIPFWFFKNNAVFLAEVYV